MGSVGSDTNGRATGAYLRGRLAGFRGGFKRNVYRLGKLRTGWVEITLFLDARDFDLIPVCVSVSGDASDPESGGPTHPVSNIYTEYRIYHYLLQLEWYSAALLGETLNTSSPTAVVESIRHLESDLHTPTASPTAVVESIRQPESDLQTPTRFTVETHSLIVPSGSTPAGDDAASVGLNVSTVHNFQSRPSTHNEPASSPAPGSCPDVLVNKTKPARGRAEFFCYVCDMLPPNASTPLPFTAMDLLDLHPTVALVGPRGPQMTCTLFWRQTAATDLFAAYLDTHSGRNKGDAIAPTNKHVTLPVPSSRDKPLSLFGASSPPGSGAPLSSHTTRHPTSPMQTCSNWRTWRRMFCFTATRTHAGGTLVSRN